MKTFLFFFLFLFASPGTVAAQTPTVANRTGSSNGKANIVSIQIGLPVGVFGESHLAGLGLVYSWSPHRFGSQVSNKKKPGFIATASTDYYLGKKINTAGYPSHYQGYWQFYTGAGIIHPLTPAGNIALTAGAMLGLYAGNAEAGLGVNLSGNYFVEERISIGPNIHYSKQSNTDALWTMAIRASYAF